MRARLRRAARSALDFGTSPWGSVLGVRTKAPVLAMTFDDGPHPEHTPALLAALAEHHSQATFFMLLTRARRHPELVAQVVSEGHEVALHGLDHQRLTRQPASQAVANVTAGRHELEALSKRSVQWFRPPYGAQNLAIWRGVRRSGLDIALWGPSLWDWKQVSQSERASRAMSGVRPGAIVLGHDGLADESDGADAADHPELDRSAWAAQMLGQYAEQGLRSVTLSQLCAAGRPIRGARFVR